MTTATKTRTSSRARRPSTVELPGDAATLYASGVHGGEIIAGPHVRDACKRHFRDLERQASEEFPWIWSVPHVEWVVDFFSRGLKLTGGASEGRPFVPLPWQAFVLGSVFGWVHPETRLRRFREAFVLTGKGSGKSPLAAGIGLKCLLADNEARAEVYSAAADMEQAKILFRDAVAMTKLSAVIERRVRLSGGPGREYNIAHMDSGSFFRPISSESQGRGKSGYRPHCVLLDEIHEHPTNAMVEFMRAGTKGREQALIFMITNAGVDRTSVCYEYWQRGIRVAAGDLDDDSFFAYICAVDEGEDPIEDESDPELGYPVSWAKTNPSLQTKPELRTFQPLYIEEQVRAAKGMPSKENVVRRLNGCQWTDADAPWIDGDMWRACEVDGLDLPSVSGFLGLDLSQKRDLTAAAKVVVRGDDLLAELRFYTPEDTLVERERRDRVPYGAWVRDGYLTAVPGRFVDYGFVVKDLTDWLKDPESSLAFDPPWMEQFQAAMDNEGLDSWRWKGPKGPKHGSGIRLVSHQQGFGGGVSESSLWMPRSVESLEGAVLENRLKVRKNPVLTWNNASAIINTDAQGNRKWDKRKATGRIDGIVALCMAVGLATQMPEKRVTKWLC